jgi:hypothetical protein
MPIRAGPERRDRIARFAFNDGNMGSRFLVGIASGCRRNLYDDERCGGCSSIRFHEPDHFIDVCNFLSAVASPLR